MLNYAYVKEEFINYESEYMKIHTFELQKKE